MAGGLGVLFGKDPLNLALEDQISFAAQVLINPRSHHYDHYDEDEVVDRPNQLVYIGISTCQHTRQKT